MDAPRFERCRDAAQAVAAAAGGDIGGAPGAGGGLRGATAAGAGGGGAAAAWPELDVAVVGGGPAGLAAALALLRVQPGLRLKVFEASPAYTQQGAGVGVAVNGARALEAIDPTLPHRLLEHAAFVSSSYTFSDATGERMPWVYGTDPTEGLATLGWASGCLLPWNAIRNTLYGGLPEGTVEFGCKAVGCSGPGLGPEEAAEEGVDDGWVTIRMLRAADGKGRVAGEVLAWARYVVAADGYFSRMRRTAADGGAPAFLGRVRWLGTVAASELAAGRVPLPLGLQRERQSEFLASFNTWLDVAPDRPLAGPPARSFVMYPSGGVEAAAGPGSGLRMVWSVSAPVSYLEEAGEPFPMPAAGDEAAPAAAAGGGGGAGGRTGHGEGVSVHEAGGRQRGAEALRRLLAATPYLAPGVRALLAATPPERVLEFGVYAHTPESYVQGAWARGRLLLLGDAAHSAPPTGQGANLAFEDAAELGAAVRRHGLGQQAFAAWEAARLRRVHDILYDGTPDASIRTPLIRAVAFEPLWCPLLLAAGPEGPEGRGVLPPQVAAEVQAAAAEGGEEAARGAVLAWSRGVVRRMVEARAAGCVIPQTVPAPAGSYRIR